jgi:tetratricopeptide (TPR) repeat protein
MKMKPVLKKIQTLCCCSLLLAVLAFWPSQGAARTDRADMPLPVRVVLSKTGALIDEKQYDRAIVELKAFRDRWKAQEDGQADPKGYHHPEIYFALGTCLLLKQDYKTAAKDFEEAVRRDPTHVGAWLNLAKASFELNNHPRAAHAFGQAYANDGRKNPEHLYYSAVAYLMVSQMPPCLAAFEKLFQTHAAAVQPAWRENYVHALLTADQPRKALRHIRQLAEAYSGDKQVQWQEILLYQYLQLDMQAQAQDYALFLTRQDPLRAKWWKALAHVDLQAGSYEPALVAMTVYSYLTPLSAQETKLLADLNFQVGIPVKAAPLYEAALAKKNNPRLIRSLAMALQQLGKTEEALAALDRFAPSGRDKDPELMMLRADLLYTLEHFKQAADAYRRAAEADKDKAGRAWLMAGYAALQIDDTQAGRQAFEKAATFRRHRKAARLALRQLAKMQPKVAGGQSRI